MTASTTARLRLKGLAAGENLRPRVVGTVDRRAMRRLVAHVLTVAAVGLLAFVLLRQPWTQYRLMQRSRVGLHAFDESDVATNLRGRRQVLMSEDSLALLLFVDPSCVECRANGRAMVALLQWSEAQGAASRMITSTDADGIAQYAALSNAGDNLLLADPRLFTRLGFRRLPALLLVDRTGAIRAKWIGHAPTHLALLNLFARSGARIGTPRSRKAKAPR